VTAFTSAQNGAGSLTNCGAGRLRAADSTGGSSVTQYYWQYGTLGALSLLGVGFVAFAFGANRLMRPRKPRPEKYTTYECGVDPVGEGWSQTQIRYYIFAFLFVIFDVESVFLFPFATVFEKFARAGIVLTEMIVFVVILAVGLLYAWKKKVLEWL
jgi:NADH-quinone oxidoreductase subunit A